MAWRRHNRHLTHEVFYEGTTVDGTRIDQGMQDIQDRFNSIEPGDIANRFVAVQYHGGFSPQPYAPPQIANVEITAVGADGNIHSVVIDGKIGSYTKVAGDTAADVVDGLILALAAAGVTNVTFTDHGDNFDATAVVPSQAFVIYYTGTGTATATVTLPVWSNRHHFPWLEIRNQGSAEDIVGEIPPLAPYNELRLKGTAVPGISLGSGSESRDGTQWAWTRVFSFKRPVILHAMNVLMQVDGGANVNRPYQGEDLTVTGAEPYAFGNLPPSGFGARDYTSDITVMVDVFNQSTPEDATMTDVAYVRRRWVVSREVFTTFVRSPTATLVPIAWDDMEPHFSSGDITDVRPIDGKLVEDRNLNMPIPAGSKVRVSVVIPQYNQTTVTAWPGLVPWYLQAMSTTLTVLEEIQAR